MTLIDVLPQPFLPPLAAALEHFVWQGAALGLALFAVIRFGRPDARLRYLLGVACLGAMALAPIVTMVAMAGAAPAEAARLSFAAGGAAPAAAAAFAPRPSATAPGWSAQSIVVLAWVIGVMALALRFLGGWVMARRVVARTRDRASAEIRWLARRLGDQLALAGHVEILVSPSVVVPMLVGWVAPVVILPAAALAGLAPAQIEALLAHELAHVRRHDYLVNLLQSAVETLLFFHPVVWWVSRDVRESREHCCDDLVVGLCDRVVYASALADLAAMVRGPRLALAATDGSLVGRVRRILDGGGNGGVRSGWLPAAILSALVVAAAPVAMASLHGSGLHSATAAIGSVDASQHPAVATTSASTADEAAQANAEADQVNVERLAELKAKLQQLSDLRDRIDQEQLAEAKAQLDKIKPLELDDVAAKKLREARLREIEETLGTRESAARTAGEDDVADSIAKMKADLDRQDALIAKLAARGDVRLEPSRTGTPMVVLRGLGKNATDFDPQEMESVITPALQAGPTDVSVVGNVVKHAGRVEWHDGLTVEAALEAAGAPPITNADNVVRRLSELSVIFGAGGPHVSGRVDDVTASTLLRPGDVIVVSPRKPR